MKKVIVGSMILMAVPAFAAEQAGPKPAIPNFVSVMLANPSEVQVIERNNAELLCPMFTVGKKSTSTDGKFVVVPRHGSVNIGVIGPDTTGISDFYYSYDIAIVRTAETPEVVDLSYSLSKTIRMDVEDATCMDSNGYYYHCYDQYPTFQAGVNDLHTLLDFRKTKKLKSGEIETVMLDLGYLFGPKPLLTAASSCYDTAQLDKKSPQKDAYYKLVAGMLFGTGGTQTGWHSGPVSDVKDNSILFRDKKTVSDWWNN